MNTHRLVWLFVFGMVASLALIVLGIFVGSTGFESLMPPLINPEIDADAALMAQKILWEIRLPRTMGAWAAGVLLGVSGALAQGLFRNPLADPYLLGSASGASLGVALALAVFGGGISLLNDGLAVGVFSSNIWVRLGLTGAAFMGAVFAVLMTLILSGGVANTLRLLLCGVVVGVVLGACTNLLMLMSPDSLQAMQSFMLGSTAFVGWNALAVMLVVCCICCLAAWFFSRVLDGLSLGEATAFTLGLPIAPTRAALIGVLALATGTAVSQTGLIAFVGLVSPHLVRAWVKTTHAYLVLLSSLVGGVLLLSADILARCLIAPQELPVGVLTAVLGGGYLLWLISRRSVRSGEST